MKEISPESIMDVFVSWEQELVQLRAVADAAQEMVTQWGNGPEVAPEYWSPQEFALIEVLRALRSGDEDRGVRGAGGAGEQEVPPDDSDRQGDHGGAERQGGTLAG